MVSWKGLGGSTIFGLLIYFGIIVFIVSFFFTFSMNGEDISFWVINTIAGALLVLMFKSSLTNEK